MKEVLLYLEKVVRKKEMTAKRISYLALFIALSVIGGLITLPSPVGSIALDSFPALIAAVWIDKNSGAIVGTVGHLMSALLSGFVLGPFHIMIAIGMGIIVWVFGHLYQSFKPIIPNTFFIITNGFILPLPFIFIMGFPFFLGILPSLVIATVLNLIISALLIPRFAPFFKNQLSERPKDV